MSKITKLEAQLKVAEDQLREAQALLNVRRAVLRSLQSQLREANNEPEASDGLTTRGVGR